MDFEVEQPFWSKTSALYTPGTETSALSPIFITGPGAIPCHIQQWNIGCKFNDYSGLIVA